MGVQHFADVAMQFGRAALGLRLDLHGEVGAFPRFSAVRRRAASTFYYIILKLPTLRYTYFLSTQTVITLPRSIARSIVCLPNS